MTLKEIVAILTASPDASQILLQEAGLPANSLDLPRRYQRALAYYRRSLELAPLDALLDDNRDHRYDASMISAAANTTALSPAQIDRMCAAYESRARRWHIYHVARRIRSRTKTSTPEGSAHGRA